MTAPILMAYSELTRVLPWSLRALGYSFPVADRASHLVATAAAMAPEILDMFRTPSPRSGAAGQLVRLGDNTYSIDAKRLSLLEIGPAVMDFVGARASRARTLRIEIDSPTDLALLPAVLLVGADYGISASAISAEGSFRAWLRGPFGPSRSIASGADLSGLTAIDRETNPTLMDAFRRDFDAGGGGTQCTIFATRVSSAGTFVGAPEVIDADASLARAYEHGIPVSAGTLKAIYDLEKITWAPTSERSRAQAGFSPQGAGVSS